LNKPKHTVRHLNVLARRDTLQSLQQQTRARACIDAMQQPSPLLQLPEKLLDRRAYFAVFTQVRTQYFSRYLVVVRRVTKPFDHLRQIGCEEQCYCAFCALLKQRCA